MTLAHSCDVYCMLLHSARMQSRAAKDLRGRQSSDSQNVSKYTENFEIIPLILYTRRVSQPFSSIKSII